MSYLRRFQDDKNAIYGLHKIVCKRGQTCKEYSPILYSLRTDTPPVTQFIALTNSNLHCLSMHLFNTSATSLSKELWRRFLENECKKFNSFLILIFKSECDPVI